MMKRKVLLLVCTFVLLGSPVLAALVQKGMLPQSIAAAIPAESALPAPATLVILAFGLPWLWKKR